MVETINLGFLSTVRKCSSGQKIVKKRIPPKKNPNLYAKIFNLKSTSVVLFVPKIYYKVCLYFPYINISQNAF